jgi:hypothetical protein
MLAATSQTAAKLLIMTFSYKMLLPTGVQMKRVIPLLVRWARRAGTIQPRQDCRTGPPVSECVSTVTSPLG